jgi:hypothetical protein
MRDGKDMMMRSIFALLEIFGGAFQAQEVKNSEARFRKWTFAA